MIYTLKLKDKSRFINKSGFEALIEVCYHHGLNYVINKDVKGLIELVILD